jgi:hypothetical protein
MATEKQKEANRRNSQKSTGPRTEEGKHNARFNALKHGMCANTPVLPHEDRAAFEQSRADLYASFEPANTHEQMLIDQAAIAHWRMLRSSRVETRLFDLQIRNLKQRQGLPMDKQHDDDGAMACALANKGEEFAHWLRYQSTSERAYYRAIRALERAQFERLRKHKLEQSKSNPRTIAKPSALPPPPQAQPETHITKEAVEAYILRRHALANPGSLTATSPGAPEPPNSGILKQLGFVPRGNENGVVNPQRAA